MDHCKRIHRVVERRSSSSSSTHGNTLTTEQKRLLRNFNLDLKTLREKINEHRVALQSMSSSSLFSTDNHSTTATTTTTMQPLGGLSFLGGGKRDQQPAPTQQSEFSLNANQLVLDSDEEMDFDDDDGYHPEFR